MNVTFLNNQYIKYIHLHYIHWLIGNNWKGTLAVFIVITIHIPYAHLSSEGFKHSVCKQTTPLYTRIYKQIHINTFNVIRGKNKQDFDKNISTAAFLNSCQHLQFFYSA